MTCQPQYASPTELNERTVSNERSSGCLAPPLHPLPQPLEASQKTHMRSYKTALGTTDRNTLTWTVHGSDPESDISYVLRREKISMCALSLKSTKSTAHHFPLLHPLVTPTLAPPQVSLLKTVTSSFSMKSNSIQRMKRLQTWVNPLE